MGYQEEGPVVRHKIMRPAFVLAGASLLAIGVAGCGGSKSSSSGGAKNASFTTTIGEVVPLTGDLAPFGPPGQKAGTLAVQQVNKALAADGLAGKVKFKVTSADEQTDPQAAVSAARKLVSDGASCLVGAYASADSIPVNQSVAARQGIPQISPASTSAEISTLKSNGTMFRTSPSDNLQGPALARFVVRSIGGAKGKTVTLAARNDAYGTGFIDKVKSTLNQLGVKTNGPIVYDPNAASYNSEAGKITATNPDAYVIIDFPQTFSKLGPALLRTGKFNPGKLFIADGLASASGQPPPQGVSVASVKGARGTAPGTPKSGVAAAAFGKLFRSSPGTKTRATFDAQNFDATMLCSLASIAAGSNKASDIKAKLRAVSGPPGTKYTFEQLPQAIKDLRAGKDIDYEGASGPIDFAANGDPTAGTYDQYGYVGPGGTYRTIGQFLIKSAG
jgi:ABC-type branched-subunit amino acid transport system substrate-binding protein